MILCTHNPVQYQKTNILELNSFNIIDVEHITNHGKLLVNPIKGHNYNLLLEKYGWF